MTLSGRILTCEVEKARLVISHPFCGIIVICGGHCSWIIEMLMVYWDVISMITVLLRHILRRFLTLLYNRKDLNSRMGTHSVHEHRLSMNNHDFKVIACTAC